MNNLSKEKKQQLVLIAVFTVGILAALWFFFVQVQQKKRLAVEKKRQEISKKVDDADKLAKKKQDIADELEAYRLELAARERDMAGADPFLWFVTLMNQYVSSQTRYLHNFQTPSISQPDNVGLLPNFPYKAVTFAVRMQAAYKDFGKFVADFENDWPHLRVQNINLNPVGGAAASVSASGTSPATEGRLDISFEVVALTLTNRANIK